MIGTVSKSAVEELIEFLDNHVQMFRGMNRATAKWPYNSMYDFILFHGREWAPHEIKDRMPMGKSRECFLNAALAVMAHDDLTYVEGLAIPTTVAIPIRHAWLVDNRGRVVDRTWTPVGHAYFGVPFKTEYVCRRLAKYVYAGSLIDDWEHNWPLLTGEVPVIEAVKEGEERVNGGEESGTGS